MHRALSGCRPRQRWPSCADAYDEETLADAKGNPTPASCCICTRRWRPSRLPCCRLQKNKLGEAATELYDEPAQEVHASITTRPAPSASATAVRTKSARPLCITVDFDTATDGCVTVRDRDTMQQERIAIADLEDYIAKRLVF